MNETVVRGKHTHTWTHDDSRSKESYGEVKPANIYIYRMDLLKNVQLFSCGHPSTHVINVFEFARSGALELVSIVVVQIPIGPIVSPIVSWMFKCVGLGPRCKTMAFSVSPRA